MKPKISIISLNYNRLKFTRDSVENLLKTTDVPYELIIVSNYDGSKTSKAVRKFVKFAKCKGGNNLIKVKKVLNNKNYGVAGGRNSGLIFARADYKMVIDDDILMPNNWASKIIKLLERVDEIGIAGYCVEKKRAADKYKIKTYNDCVFQSKGRDNIGGACMVIPKRTFDRLGYFNEDYGIFGFEDADYGARVAALGKINAYVYPERAIQQKDVITHIRYKEWKSEIYKSKKNMNFLGTNILKYQNKKALHIGKDKIKNKWFDLH